MISGALRHPAIVAVACVLTMALGLPASAQPVGGCTASTSADRCEGWSVIYNDDAITSPHRADEFATSVSTSESTVFTTTRTVAMDVNNPYDASARWTVLAHDRDTGELRWDATRTSRHYDSPLASVVSADGATLFVTGSAYDGYPVGRATDAHIVTVAYDANTGGERWSKVWDGRPDGTDAGKTIAVSPNGKTVVVGGITSTADGSLDYVTIAYDVGKGRELWSRTAGGLQPDGTDSLNGIAMSPRGDLVYVTGESAGVAEFDADYLTIAYDVRKGKVAWTARFAGLDEGGSDRASAVAISPDGARVYVTGDSFGGRRDGTTQYDYATVAYDARSGAEQWVGRWSGPTAGFNYPVAVVAAADHVVVTGQSRGATADDVRDFGTVAYDAVTGVQAWEARYAPPRHDEIALDLALSPDGSTAFVTGSSSPVVNYTDLDAAATVAYRTSDGAQQWASRLDMGPGNAVLGRHLAATADGGVAVVGQVTYSADLLKDSSQNIYDTLIVKY
jgi:hypothetical protein